MILTLNTLKGIRSVKIKLVQDKFRGSIQAW